MTCDYCDQPSTVTVRYWRTALPESRSGPVWRWLATLAAKRHVARACSDVEHIDRAVRTVKAAVDEEDQP